MQLSPQSPPHDIAAEASMLGALFIKPAAIFAVADVAIDDLFLPAHREILESVRNVHARKQPPDLHLVADDLKVRGMLPRLEGGESYLVKIASEVPTAENIEYYARLVRQKAQGRRLASLGSEIYRRAMAGESPQEIAPEVLGGLSQAMASTDPLRPIGHEDDFVEVLEKRYEASLNGHRPVASGIPTGIGQLDEVIGGMQSGDVHILAANPGHGKSALAMQMAINHALPRGAEGRDPGGVVLFFAMEMRKQQVKERMYAHIAEINNGILKHGHLGKPSESRMWLDVGRAHDVIARMAFYIDAGPKTIDQIEARTAEIKSRHPHEEILVVVDYMQLAKSPSFAPNDRVGRITDVSFRLKNNVAGLGTTVLAVAQPNREGKKASVETGKMEVHHLDGSGAIENDASVIMIVENRAKMQKQDEGQILIHVDKNRDGQGGIVVEGHWVGRWLKMTTSSKASPPLGPTSGHWASSDSDHPLG